MAIEEAGHQYDLIDLQYSSTTVDQNGTVEYSVLMLLGERSKNNGTKTD